VPILLLSGYAAIKKGGHKCHLYRKLSPKRVFFEKFSYYNNNITLPFLLHFGQIINNLITLMIKKYINFNYIGSEIINL